MPMHRFNSGNEWVAATLHEAPLEVSHALEAAGKLLGIEVSSIPVSKVPLLPGHCLAVVREQVHPVLTANQDNIKLYR